MALTISFPFRLQPNGAPATQVGDTDAHYVELLTALVMTRPGERHLAPGFGTADPSFGAVDLNGIQAATDLYGPPVQVSEVEARFTNSTTQEILVGFK